MSLCGPQLLAQDAWHNGIEYNNDVCNTRICVILWPLISEDKNVAETAKKVAGWLKTL